MIESAGLYVHIPFCDARCDYCDFVTFVDREKQIGPYLKALDAEFSLYDKTPLKTVFVGGGTPSVLSPAHITALFSSIRARFDLSRLGEVTVESNPESVTPERLGAFVAGGVNRISFGLQTDNDADLKRIGRLHNFEKFLKALAAARAAGLKNINIDLIYGLPGQTLAAWMKALETVAALNPQHVSAYALKVETGTPLALQGVAVDPDLQADMYLAGSEFLSAKGYVHYEISNFAKPGYESRHNRLYWENAETIGAGVSAVSYLGGRRTKNTTSLGTYISGLKEGKRVFTDQTNLIPEERIKEDVMLALRMRHGVPQEDVRKLNVRAADQFLSAGLAVVEDGRYRLTPAGWLVSNQLFQYLV